MCRLESISFDMESRSGSTFCLFDCLASGVIGMLTIGINQRATVKFMSEALNFVSNQAGAIPKKIFDYGVNKPEPLDQISFFDIIQRVKTMNRAYEKRDQKNAV